MLKCPKFVVLLALAACISPLTLAKDGVTKSPFVRLSRGSCFGICPVYSITVYGNGGFVYEGTGFVQVQGKRKGRLSPKDTAELFSEIKTQFFRLKSRYGNESDLPATTIVVSIQNRRKVVTDFTGTKEVEHLSELIERLTSVERFISWRLPPDPLQIHPLHEPEPLLPQLTLTPGDFPDLPFQPTTPSLKTDQDKH
jgi:hypothetical protein